MTAKIYLDFNSTHPPDAVALAAGREFYLAHFANSSGLSLASQQVNERIERAREDIARLLLVTAEQVIFTSCATESNNLLVREFHSRHKAGTFRVLTSPFEHPSIAETLKQLENTEIHAFKAESNGTISENSLKKALAEPFDLITLMATQNESGVLLPALEMMNALGANHMPVIVDFSQALPKLCNEENAPLSPRLVKELTARGAFLTATGHKTGAGFGAGLIITPPGHAALKKTALLAGGNQEFGLRAGSHNTEAIISLAEALKRKLAANSYPAWQKVTGDFASLLKTAISKIAGAKIIAEDAPRAPGTLLLLLPQVPIDFLIMALDREGITVSTGTSCKSRSRSPSQALFAMGYSEAEALSVIRLSFDQNLTPADMARTADVLQQSLARLK